MKLEEVKALIEKSQYDDALAECENLLSHSPEQKVEILRTRAYAFARSGDYEKSLEDHESIFESGEAAIGDYYLAAFRALYTEQFEEARGWFLDVLRLGNEHNEDWFLTATLFYLSYVNMRLKNYGDAIEFLNEATLVSADIGLPIPEVGMCTNEQLREEIERRALSNKVT